MARVLTPLGFCIAIVFLASINLGSFSENSDSRTKAAVDVLIQEYQKRSNSSPEAVHGRLTLTSGTAITTSDVTAATTVYFTPFNGAKISLYNGDSWALLSFSEVSVVVPSTTETPFDVFAYDNSGSLALQAVSWTDDSTRATDLAKQNGVYVKSGALRYRYLGTGRTTSVSGQTEDSASKRFLWNYYNRQSRSLYVRETTASWSYGSTPWRPANNDVDNRVEIVVGVAEVVIKLLQHGLGPALSESSMGIGINSTDTPSSFNFGRYIGAGTNIIHPEVSSVFVYPNVGYNFYQWMESTSANSPTDYYGTSASDSYENGLTGSVEG